MDNPDPRVFRLLSFFFIALFLYLPTVTATPRKRFGQVYNQWIYAHATFYGNPDGSGTNAGACGYGNNVAAGYGRDHVAVSSALWKLGYACGGCMEVICLNTNTWKFCHQGYPRVTVTVTNMCPQAWHKPNNRGGWCNNPRKHLDLSEHAFHQLAQGRAGIVPIIYRRVPCKRDGGIKFLTRGNYWWFELSVQNIAGSGDLQKVYFKVAGSNRWTRMFRSWGTVYFKSGTYVEKPIDMILHSLLSDEITYIPNALPTGWRPAKAYQSKIQFPISSSYARKLLAGEVVFDEKKFKGSEMVNFKNDGLDLDSDSSNLEVTSNRKTLSDDSTDLSKSISGDHISQKIEFEKNGRFYPGSSDIEVWETGLDVDDEYKQFLNNVLKVNS